MPTSKSRVPGFYSVIRFSAVFLSLCGHSIILSYAFPFQLAIQNHRECTYEHYISSPMVTHPHGCLYLSVLSFDGLVLLSQGERLGTPGTELHSVVLILFIFNMVHLVQCIACT
jgi:hypothetical protein